jgi:hypothetical protein
MAVPLLNFVELHQIIAAELQGLCIADNEANLFNEDYFASGLPAVGEAIRLVTDSNAINQPRAYTSYKE